MPDETIATLNPSDFQQVRVGAHVSAEGLCKKFGRKEVLRGISLAIPSGAIVGLVGINGAGKTTILKILLGLVLPDKGSVRLSHGDGDAVRVGFLPEEADLPRELTASELLAAALWRAGYPAEAARIRRKRLLEIVGMSHAARIPTRAMSKGMRRRISLALALANHPTLLVLDEPQSGLDPHGRRDLETLIRNLNREGCSILLASHDLVQIQSLSHRIAVIHKGVIAFEEDAQNISPGELERRFFEIVGTVTPEETT